MRSNPSARPPARVVGILAGGGALPRELAESVRARGAQVHIVALDGEADGDFSGFPLTRLGWGKVGGMLRAFRRAGATDIVFVGSVRRPDLTRLRPDLGFVLGLPELLALVLRGGGDDRILRAVVRFFERRGMRVVGPASLAPQLIVGRGVLGRAQPSAVDRADIARAIALLHALSPFDIGQGVVVRDGRVEAIEAAENTDAMLARVGERRLAQSSPVRGGQLRGGVLVKLAKRGQERRIDLPAIGILTATGAAAAGLAGVAVEAGSAIAVRRDDMMARADAADVFVAGIEVLPDTQGGSLGGSLGGNHSDRPPRYNATTDHGSAAAGWRALEGKSNAVLLRDAAKGLAVQAAAAEFGAARVVVVARGHVLAVEADEGCLALLARVGTLRQWGARGSRRRGGVAVLSEAEMLTPDVIARAAAAGLACLAIAEAGCAMPASGIVAAARVAGVGILLRPDLSAAP